MRKKNFPEKSYRLPETKVNAPTFGFCWDDYNIYEYGKIVKGKSRISETFKRWPIGSFLNSRIIDFDPLKFVEVFVWSLYLGKK